MPKRPIAISGKEPKHQLEQILNNRVYEKYRFNKLDSYLRQEGFVCLRLYSLHGMQFVLAELRGEIRGEVEYLQNGKHERGKLDSQFLIIPANTVLTRNSIKQLCLTDPFRHLRQEDFYAFYVREKVKHSSYAQTHSWPEHLKKSLDKK